MQEIIAPALSSLATIIVALIGYQANRWAKRSADRETKAKEEIDKAQAEVRDTLEREQFAWSQVESNIERLEKQLGDAVHDIYNLTERVRTAEERAREAEKERDAALDENRNKDQIIAAFVQDRIDLDRWAGDGGKPPVPEPSWRVVTIIDRHRRNSMYGATMEVEDDGNV